MEDATRIVKERAKAALKALADGAPGAGPLADAALNELRAALRDHPAAGGELGPIVGRLQAAQKARPASAPCQWVGVGGGHLAVGHRPKLKGLPALRQHGATHILTLLDESEGAAEIGEAARRAGMDWVWFPLASATPPADDRVAEVRALYEAVRAVLATGGRVYIHCSAGIHRTGMITYGLLRSLGMAGAVAVATLHALRAETGKGVGETRLAWGEQFGPPGAG